jgi:sec-independent protein translocase protein TatA
MPSVLTPPFGFGMPELMVVLVIALIFFGPGKLPELGGLIGKALRDFRKAMDTSEKKLDMPESDKNEGRKE